MLGWFNALRKAHILLVLPFMNVDIDNEMSTCYEDGLSCVLIEFEEVLDC